MAFPWWKRIRLWWFFLGCVLPDIIDKTFFYFVHYIGISDLISGRRAMGHSLLFLLLLFLAHRWSKSQILFSLCLGTISHVILDFLGISWFLGDGAERNLRVLFWPFLGFKVDKLHESIPLVLAFILEGVGLILLISAYLMRGRLGFAKNSGKNI